MSPGNMESDVLQRILKYAQNQKQHLRSQEAGAIFNDLQVILSNTSTSGKSHLCGTCRSRLEGDIIRMRNLMNITHRITVSREWEGM